MTVRFFSLLVVSLAAAGGCSRPNQNEMIGALEQAGIEAIRPYINSKGGLDFSLPSGGCTATLEWIDTGGYVLWVFDDGERIDRFPSFDRKELEQGARTRHCFEGPKDPLPSVSSSGTSLPPLPPTSG